MPQQHGKSGQANSPRRPGLQIERCRWRDGRQCIEPRIKPEGKDDRPSAFQNIYQEHHKERPFPQGSQYVRCPSGFGALLSDINAFEQFPRQIARGRGTEEISDRQSNHTRYPENHGIYPLISTVPATGSSASSIGSSNVVGLRRVTIGLRPTTLPSYSLRHQVMVCASMSTRPSCRCGTSRRS